MRMIQRPQAQPPGPAIGPRGEFLCELYRLSDRVGAPPDAPIAEAEYCYLARIPGKGESLLLPLDGTKDGTLFTVNGVILFPLDLDDASPKVAAFVFVVERACEEGEPL